MIIVADNTTVEGGETKVVPGDNFLESGSEIVFAQALIPCSPPPISQHAPSVYISSLAPVSRKTMSSAIEHIAQLLSAGKLTVWTLPWHALRYEHTVAVRARLMEINQPATVKKKLSALKGVLKTAWRLGQIDSESYYRAIDLPPVTGETLLAGRMVPSGELRALVDICATGPAIFGARDAAILATMAGCGLRRSEIVGLDLADYTEEDGALFVRQGKGNKQRINYVRGGAQNAIEYWIEQRGHERGPLFLPITKSGRILWRRLSDQTIMDILLKRTAQAGVLHCSPHDLRRTYISNLLGAGIDIKTVSRMVGHADVTTTANYDRRGEDEKQKAAEVLHFPFVRPLSN